MSAPTKLLVVVGATGNQGGSVVTQFLKTQDYKIRGLTRNAASAKAKALAEKGVEVLAADLDDVSSLKKAFEGASAIFAVTDFWGPYNDPRNANKGKENNSMRNAWVYQYELQQGKNIFQAASETSNLERLVYSSLADCINISGGKYSHVYHFDSKGHAVNHARDKYPELMAKTSILQATIYLSNWLNLPNMIPQKSPDGKYMFVSSFQNFKMPLIAAEEDTGPFVAALLKVSPGKNLMAYREKLSIEEFVNKWGQILRKEFTLIDPSKMGPQPDMDEEAKSFMQEFAEGGQFFQEFGYAGEKVDKTVVTPSELGVDVDLPTAEDWIRKQDWSAIL